MVQNIAYDNYSLKCDLWLKSLRKVNTCHTVFSSIFWLIYALALVFGNAGDFTEPIPYLLGFSAISLLRFILCSKGLGNLFYQTFFVLIDLVMVAGLVQCMSAKFGQALTWTCLYSFLLIPYTFYSRNSVVIGFFSCTFFVWIISFAMTFDVADDFEMYQAIFCFLAVFCFSLTFLLRLNDDTRQPALGYQGNGIDVDSLSEKAKVRKEFLKSISHEMRTPLNVILGGLDEKSNPKIRQNAAHLLEMIDNILLLNEIDLVDKEKSEEFDPFDVICEMVSAINDFLPEDDVVVILEGSNVKLTTAGLVEYFNRFFKIIFSVAQRYSKSGKIFIRMKFDEKYSSLELNITDLNGSFEQKVIDVLDISRTGFNISQTTLKELAKSLNASVVLQSKNSLLSNIDIKIPIKPVRRQISLHNVSQPDKVEIVKSPKILIVDDAEENLLITQSMLKKMKFDVGMARNGKDAIMKLKNDEFDLILMDCMMPIMDGYEATKTIRQMGWFDIPIIALTAHALQSERQKALLSGMDGYITKPVQFLQLKKIILKQFLNKRPSVSNVKM